MNTNDIKQKKSSSEKISEVLKGVREEIVSAITGILAEKPSQEINFLEATGESICFKKDWGCKYCVEEIRLKQGKLEIEIEVTDDSCGAITDADTTDENGMDMETLLAILEQLEAVEE